MYMYQLRDDGPDEDSDDGVTDGGGEEGTDDGGDMQPPSYIS